MTEDERLHVIEIKSMQELFGKMAGQIKECADFIIHYSETKSFCESNSLCCRLPDSQCRSLHREKTWQEHRGRAQ
jgi:hypothetical protein